MLEALPGREHLIALRSAMTEERYVNQIWFERELLHECTYGVTKSTGRWPFVREADKPDTVVADALADTASVVNIITGKPV